MGTLEVAAETGKRFRAGYDRLHPRLAIWLFVSLIVWLWLAPSVADDLKRGTSDPNWLLGILAIFSGGFYSIFVGYYLGIIYLLGGRIFLENSDGIDALILWPIPRIGRFRKGDIKSGRIFIDRNGLKLLKVVLRNEKSIYLDVGLISASRAEIAELMARKLGVDLEVG